MTVNSAPMMLKKRLQTAQNGLSVCVMISMMFGLLACSQSDNSLTIIQAEIAALQRTVAADPAVPVPLDKGFKIALRAAVLQNAAYRAASARAAAALVAIDDAQAVERMQSSASARIGTIRETGSGIDATTSGASGGVQLTKLLYDGGASHAGVNQARAKAIAAQADLWTAANDIALSAARAWVDLWQSGKRLALIHDRLERLDGSTAQLQRMAELGLIDKAAVGTVTRQAAALRQDRVQIIGYRDEAAARVQQYFGAADFTPPRPTEIAAKTRDGDWMNAPILTRLAANIVNANAALDQANAAASPIARLQGAVTAPHKQGDATEAAIGVVFEYKLGDGGQGLARLQAAKHGLTAARAQLADAQIKMQSDFSTALVARQSAKAALPELKTEILLAASEAETARSQIQTGQSNLRQLVEAELAHYRAEDRLIQLKMQAFIADLSLLAMTGDLAKQIGAVQ